MQIDIPTCLCLSKFSSLSKSGSKIFVRKDVMRPWLRIKKWWVQRKPADSAYLTVEVIAPVEDMVDCLDDLCKRSPESVRWWKHRKSYSHEWLLSHKEEDAFSSARSSIFALGHDTFYWKEFIQLLNQIAPEHVWFSGFSMVGYSKVEVQFISNPAKARGGLHILHT